MNTKFTAVLKNWSFSILKQDLDAHLYSAPETLISATGNVYDHPNQSRFKDGKYIRTSIIDKHYKEKDGEFILTSSGTLYKLEDINPDYQKYLDQQKEDQDVISSS